MKNLTELFQKGQGLFQKAPLSFDQLALTNSGVRFGASRSTL